MRTAENRNAATLYPLLTSPKKAGRIWGLFDTTIPSVERLADLVAASLAVLLANSAYEFLHVGKQIHYSPQTVSAAAVAFSVMIVLLLGHDGAYERTNSLLRIRETERVLRVSSKALAVALSVTFLFSHLFSRGVLALGALFVPLLLVIEKQVLYLLIREMHSRGYGLQNVLVYGAGYTGRHIFSALVRSPKLGLNPVGIVDDDDRLAGQEIYEYAYTRQRSVPVMAGPVTRDLIRASQVSLVLVGIPSLPQQRLREIAAEAAVGGATVAFVPQLSCGSEALTDYLDMDGVLIASLSQPAGRRFYEVMKRIFDMVFALTLLAFSLPVWALIALAIRCDSEGPVFFRQLRVGKHGKRFELYKFRSMRMDAPIYGFHPSGMHDPRITRTGRWIRQTSLDELPQLINILRGDMSLVGPRPEMPFIVDAYTAHHRQRLRVTPGLTGLWQLSADRSFLIHENLQYDLYYIRDRNFFMDLAILLHTAVFAMKGV